MKYFVIWPNGQRFGPVDVDSLRNWLVENRIDSNSLLEEEFTGRQYKAGDVLGLHQGPQPMPGTPSSQTTFQQPPTASGYYRAPTNYPSPFIAARTGSSNGETIAAWILGVLGLVSCAFCMPLIGIVVASVGKGKGQSGAMPALIFNVVVLIVNIASIALGGAFGLFD